MNGETRRRLPVIRTTIQAYRETFRNLGYAIRISWAWFILLVVVAIAIALTTGWLQLDGASDWGIKADLVALNAQDSSASTVFVATVAFLAALLLYLLAMSSIAVAWHRRLLAGESRSGLVYLHVGRTVWRYLGYSVLLFLILILLYFVVELALGLSAIGLAFALYGGVSSPQESPLLIAWIGAAVLLALLIVALILARLSVLLPGIALDHKELSFRRIWRRTKGNSWRLFLGSMLCWLLPSILLGGISFAISLPRVAPGLQAAMSTGDVLLAILNQIIGIVVGFIGLSFLAFAYRFFYEPESLPPQDAAL